MECVLCNKQYTCKSEKIFSLRLNNHRKYVNKRKIRLATFSTIKLTRQNLQKTCDLSLTFNVCQKYLALPPLQLIPETYLIRSLANSAAFHFGLLFASSFWSLPCLSPFKTN